MNCKCPDGITRTADFVYTSCGDIGESGNMVSVNSGERWIGRFWYSGSKFVNAYDNC